MGENIEGLQHLLKAPSKKLVDEIFNQSWLSRNKKTIPPILIESLVAALKIKEQQATELVESIRYIIKIAVYENSANLGSLFAPEFHKDLRTLILAIIETRLPIWREDAIKNQCSLPKLMEIDWRIDIKRASESLSSMSVPTVLVQLKVDNSSATGKQNTVQAVNFELNKQTLETVLDGLTKIKQQLSSLK